MIPPANLQAALAEIERLEELTDDLQRQLDDAQRDVAYWRQRCEDSELERDNVVELNRFRSYGRRLP